MQMKFGRAIKSLFGQIFQCYPSKKQRQTHHTRVAFVPFTGVHVIRREAESVDTTEQII